MLKVKIIKAAIQTLNVFKTRHEIPKTIQDTIQP